MLLSARLQGQPALLYVLFEHQATVDRFMPMRLTRYVMRVWERWLRDHPRSTTLPAVIPIVLHQGPGQWDGPRRLAELIQLPAELLGRLERFMPGLEMIVDDLGALSPAALAARPGRHQVRVTWTLLRGIHDPDVDVTDLLALLRESLRALMLEAGGVERLRRAMLYIVRQRSGLDAKALVESVRRVAGPEVGEVAMSTYQELIDEGARNLVERQLRTKFGDLSPDVLERLAAATTRDLETWGERLLTADTLDDVFSARPRRATSSARSRRKRRK